MKCDELKRFEIVGKYTDDETIGECYDADEVDAAIAELKSEIKRKDGVCKRWFARCMEARTENRKLKRALWLARAISAINAVGEIHNVIVCMRERHPKMSLSNTEAQEQVWKNVVRKCRAKAEEYK